MTVIIPSKSAENLRVSAAVVRDLESNAKIIVADDGVEWDYIPAPLRRDLTIVECPKPFIYSRSCNLGIQACDDDVVLLNDDAILYQTNGFTAMQQEQQAHPEYGLIGATTNLVGNRRQFPTKAIEGLREEPQRLCFVCVYIPRSTINLVGLLDERFVDYGYEDDDYSLRVTKAGLKLGICDGCYVNHLRLKSSYRHDKEVDPSKNQALFLKKWGLLDAFLWHDPPPE